MTAASLPADLAGDEATPDPVTHALNLAAAGLAVLPALADKRPAPGYGVTSATTDPQAIADAFITTGAPLVGVACGASGIVVVDIDRHPGAPDGLASVAEAGVELPATWVHTSMSGTGLHAVYAAPGEPVSAAKPLPGVDLKAGNGYVVWPLSAGVPRREQFAPLPAWASLPRGDAGGEISDEAVAEWIGGNAGPIAPEGDLARALAALPPHGSPEWNDANLIPLARSIATAAQWETGGALAREQFIARYAAGEWATPEHRKAAARAFDKAADRFGMPYPLLTSAPVIDIATRTDLEAPASEPAPVGGFRVLTRADLKTMPRPEWLVEGLVQESGIIVLAGEGGLGKSFLAVDWACSIATGSRWHGRNVRRGRVLYVAGEGAEFYDQRVTAWEIHNVASVPDDRLHYVTDGFSLSDEHAVEQMRSTVASGGYDLVILDTLSQLSAVENENDNAQLAAVMRQARAIRQARPGTTVLIVHHVSKGERGKVRGASAIRNNADAVIVAKPKAGDTFMLSTRLEDDGKQKNGRAEALFGFYLREIGEAAVVDRERAADPDLEAVRTVLDVEGWHPIGDFLEARGESDASTSKRLRRTLDKMVEHGEAEAEGNTKAKRWRRLDSHLDRA